MRSKLSFSPQLEQLEQRFCLDGMPLLWLEDNDFGNDGGLPADFAKRFQDPVTWQVALRSIDTMYLRESSFRNALNRMSDSFVRDTIVPVLNSAQANVAIDSSAANFLKRRVASNRSSVDQELDSHFRWLDAMVASGLRIQTVSLRGLLSQTAPGDLNWSGYSMNDRISDVVDYAVRLSQRYSWIRVGIIDSLPTQGLPWGNHYDALKNALQASGLKLDHIHLDMPVDVVGEGKRFQWSDVHRIQSFVQTSLGSKFGLLLNSHEGGSFSSDRWGQRTIFGLGSYQEAIRQIANADAQPDRIIITSSDSFPATSVPESMPDPVVEGVDAFRLRNTAQVVVQASNLLRAYQDFSESRLQNELLHVFPVAASASSTASLGGRSAEHAVFGRGVLDATESIDRFQWQASSNDSNPWIKASLPKPIGIDRVRLWPYRGTSGVDGGAIADLYVSSSGVGNPVANPTEWRLVSTADLRQSSEDYVESRFNLTKALSVAVRFRSSIGVPGLAAMRIFAPVPGWISPYTSPLLPRIPEVEVRYEHVQTGEFGAKIAELWVAGAIATNRYSLSLEDPRFELRTNQLFLRSNASLNRTQTPGVAIWVTLQDRLQPSLSFSKLVSFLVYPAGTRPMPLDYGDAPNDYPVLQSQGGASHIAVGPILGNLRQSDSDGSPSANADAARDDDGVRFVGLRVGSSESRMEIQVTGTSVAALVDAWIDLDGDGTWNGPNEKIVSRWSVLPGASSIRFTVPANAQVGNAFARVRLSTRGSASPKGPAGDGEVEDYVVQILPALSSNAEFSEHLISSTMDGARMAIPFDFDRDGDADIVTVSEFDSSIRLLLQSGAQQFQTILVGSLYMGTSVFPTDIDGDGDFDFLATSYGNENTPGVGEELLLFRNDGSLVFTRVSIANGLPGAYYVTAADMDGDGDLDPLVTVTRGNRVLWFENQGTGSFRSQTVGNVALPRIIDAADVDGDEDQDLVVTSQGSNQVLLYRNNGNQQFATEILDANLSEASDAIFSDFDLDGDLDVVASQFGGSQVRWYENLTTGFRSRVVTAAAPNARIQVVDLDGDGLLDILASEILQNRITWHQNRGGLQFDAKTIAENVLWGQQVRAVDMDRDGDLDIVAASWQDDSIRWFEQASVDRGDAPASFSSVNGDASHTISSLFLGRRVDSDAEPQPSPSADADDRDRDGNDDDGVVLLATLRSTPLSYSSSLFVFASEAGYLDGWIDFNGNGRFEHPQEHLHAGTSRLLNQGQNFVSILVPANIAPGVLTARFRISSRGGLTPTGLVTGGEVEDYNFLVASPGQPPQWCVALNQMDSIRVQVDTSSTLQVRVDGNVVLQPSGTDPVPLQVIGNGQDNIFEIKPNSLLTSTSIQGGMGVDTVLIDETDTLLVLSERSNFAMTSIERLNTRNNKRQSIHVADDAVRINPVEEGSTILIADPLDRVTFESTWKLGKPTYVNNEFTHRMTNGTEWIALQNTEVWTNPLKPFDVNADGQVSPYDALLIINFLNQGVGLSSPDANTTFENWRYWDPNRSGSVTPFDALLVINAINLAS